ncbi:MAG: VOC family protein [Ideonella sp.]|nr:VOC family protein [Ideonella sp.]
MAPRIEAIDHLHIFVGNRQASERWYADVLGFSRIPELAFWARDGGPLTLQDAGRQVHLALFERPHQPCRSTIALRVSAQEFLAWRAHLSSKLPEHPKLENHEVSLSLYFADPDGNPFEITTYEYEVLRDRQA